MAEAVFTLTVCSGGSATAFVNVSLGGGVRVLYFLFCIGWLPRDFVGKMLCYTFLRSCGAYRIWVMSWY